MGYVRGTPNGIRMDPASALVWSPSHFTWMDTNYPAATPREGYPVEIQVLWICLLRQLARLRAEPEGESWQNVAQRAAGSLERFFWLEEQGYVADLLIARNGQSAAEAIIDNALRSNYLLAISLGFFPGERARRGVEAALRYLVVPGALRSLAPLPAAPPLPVISADGRPLNDPNLPYQGRYQGDEDTSRKPAYHNGTAWTFTFPVFCEALARAWDFAPQAVAAAKAGVKVAVLRVVFVVEDTVTDVGVDQMILGDGQGPLGGEEESAGKKRGAGLRPWVQAMAMLNSTYLPMVVSR